MGCINVKSAVDADASARRNDEIEKQLQEDRLLAKNEYKLLLMGTDKSGKSDLLQKMKLVMDGGYSKAERDSYKKVIFSSMVHSMRIILEALPDLELQLDPRNRSSCKTIISLQGHPKSDTLSCDVANAIRELYSDFSVKEAVRRSQEFHLDDSAVYYFNEIERLADPSYLPSEQDILHTYPETKGVSETAFKVGEITYKISGVGRQRGERRKWLHCFENVTALIFVVDLNTYDEMLYEVENVTRMQESLTVFDSICNSRWFTKTSIILLLNNIDSFSKKLSTSPLSNYFEDYTGGDNYDLACEYLLQRFVSLNQHPSTKQIYAHYTSTSDFTQVKFILSAIQDIALQLYLSRSQ